jgi:superfamily I DNA/RNA helicase
MTRDQIAVFYRTNAHSRVLEDILVRYELPYQVIGGTKFYERAEIKDAVAYFQLLLNPADEISLPGSSTAAAGDRRPAGPDRNHASRPAIWGWRRARGYRAGAPRPSSR